MGYADILKKIKAEVRDKQTLENIKGVRRTARGNVVITTRQGEAGNLKKAIQGITQMTNVRELQNKKVVTLHARGMDAVTTVEEIKAAVEKACEAKDVEVKALRPMRNGSQAATIKMDEGKAKQLLSMNRIRIRLAICRIEERINIGNCFKCWNFRHLAAECSGPDRRGNCYKCGEAGHSRKQCGNEASCILCKQRGHETGGNGCPEVKAALEKERRRTTKQPQ